MNILKHTLQLGIALVLFPFVLSAQKAPKDFIRAAKKADIYQIQTCLKNGVEINAIDNKGATALMYASESGSVELVIYLLSKGADYRIKNDNNENALIKAKEAKGKEIIDVLEYTKAKAENSMASYSAYIKHYKHGNYIEEANTAIEEIEYNTAIAENSIDRHLDFLDKYSESEHGPELQNKVEKMRYENVCEKNEVIAFQTFKNLYPEGFYSRDITKRLNILLADYLSIPDDSKSLVNEIDKLIHPLELEQLYTDCKESKTKDDGLLHKLEGKSSGKGDIVATTIILDEQFVQRADFRDPNKKWSTYARTHVGHQVSVKLLEGELSMLDIYSGSTALEKAKTMIILSNPSSSSERIIPFDKISFYNENGEEFRTLLHNDGKFFQIKPINN